jgi:hypothetical protein
MHVMTSCLIVESLIVKYRQYNSLAMNMTVINQAYNV